MLDKLRNNIGVIFVVLAIILGATYFYQLHTESNQADCQASYNTAFAENLTLRSQLSGQRQDAEDALLTTVSALVLHPATNAADKLKENQDFTQAFQTYTDATAAYDAQKDANPLPPIPSC